MSDKKKIRKIILEKRGQLSQEEIQKNSKKIMDKVFSLKEFINAKIVMFYVDAKNEVQTREAITKALAMGKRVVVPKTLKGHGLEAVEIKSLDELKPGVFGIMEPEQKVGIDPQEIDFVVVPGVAFDKNCARIGYGAGYYDHFLPKLRPEVKKVAVAFDIQVLDKIDSEPHDVKMDLVITENQVFPEELSHFDIR